MSFDTQWMSFKQVQENGLGNSEKGDYYQVLGTVLMIRTENAIYKSCPTDNCNKKLVDLANGMFKCEKCNREYPNYDYRLLLQVGEYNKYYYYCLVLKTMSQLLSLLLVLVTSFSSIKQLGVNRIWQN